MVAARLLSGRSLIANTVVTHNSDRFMRLKKGSLFGNSDGFQIERIDFNIRFLLF